MATAQVNESLATPSKWQNVAVSTPLVADHTLVSGTLDLAYRYIVVGVIVDAVTFYDHRGNEQIFSLGQLNALNGVVIGNWTGIKTGTASYNFRCGQ